VVESIRLHFLLTTTTTDPRMKKSTAIAIIGVGLLVGMMAAIDASNPQVSPFFFLYYRA
jgi:hypothetical protein